MMNVTIMKRSVNMNESHDNQTPCPSVWLKAACVCVTKASSMKISIICLYLFFLPLWRLCFSSLSVGLFVSRITQKLLHWFPNNLVKREPIKNIGADSLTGFQGSDSWILMEMTDNRGLGTRWRSGLSWVPSLFVCLSTCWTDFHVVLWRGGAWPKKLQIKLWSGSGWKGGVFFFEWFEGLCSECPSTLGSFEFTISLHGHQQR